MALLISIVCAASTKAAPLSEEDVARYRAAYAAAAQNQWDYARKVAGQADNKLGMDVLRWMDYTRPDSTADFQTISQFIAKHPDWPELAGLRRQAEQSIPAEMDNAAVLEWFSGYGDKPLSTPGFYRFIDALFAGNQTAKATAAVRDHWIESNFGAEEESDYLARYSNLLRRQDHIARLNRLLWDDADAPARRMFRLVGENYQLLADARLRLADSEPGVERLVAMVPAALASDPGLLYERVRWRRRKDQTDGALELLALAPAHPDHAALWWAERSILIRRLMDDAHYARAYQLAKAHGQTEGQTLAQAEFLAGWLALRMLDKPQIALGHFETIYAKTTTPLSHARAAYWAGRALEEADKDDAADDWYEKAAAYPGTFYGQLAAQHLEPSAPFKLPADPPVSAEAAAAFAAREVVRIAEMFHQLGDDERAALFLRHAASTATSATDAELAGRLATRFNHPELAVNIAKDALKENGTLLVSAGYPVADFARTTQPEPALVHAIIRQESTFDHNAVSPVGARGLMQLMPATAEHVASLLGLFHTHAMLTSNPAHNVRLGSAYLQQMLDSFNGSYVLAIASYNAGPARVSEWLKTYGDPRAEGVDPIDWIENIPISETRNYVQRVMESFEIYRRRLSTQDLPPTLLQDLSR